MAQVILSDGRKLLVDVSHPMPADLVAVEDRFDISADELSGPDSRVKWTLFVIWRMARRIDPAVMGQTFEEFVDIVEDVMPDEGDDAVDPTSSTEAAPPIA
jgi:hypothetical protein